MAYTNKQQRRAKHIYGVGRKRGESRKEILAALETALVESNLGNPTMAESDQDSAGWRQERSHYGSQAKRRNIRGAARRFFSETSALGSGKGMSAAQLAQAVQRSAYPGRYGEREGQARDLLAWLDKSYGKGGGGKRGGGRRSRSTLDLKSQTIPGVDNSAMRDQVKFDYLANREDPNALLGLAKGLSEAADVPAQTETRLVKKKGALLPAGRARGGARGGDSPVLAETANRTAGQMLNLALKVDRKKPAYRLGGGHGLKPAEIGELVDCSGFVSQILGISPRVSGQYESWGRPGRGKFVTVYANAGHVLMSIRDPRTKKTRWFGTSRSNPGGGAGEISPPPALYLKGFVARHPGRKKRR